MTNFKSKEPIELQPTDDEMTEYVRVSKDEYEKYIKYIDNIAERVDSNIKLQDLKEWLEEKKEHFEEQSTKGKFLKGWFLGKLDFCEEVLERLG